MSTDPRYFTVKSCPVDSQSAANSTAKKKSFLDNIMKVGDLEILNDVGFGKVGSGLRILSSVSDSIRTGESVVPGQEGSDTYNSTLGKIAGTAAESVSEGANVVLDTIGLGGAVEKVGSFNPAVANTAYGQAKSIFQQVKNGKFRLSDIPNNFQDLQNLETLARGIFGSDKAQEPAVELCGASPYARDLIAYAPKFKFLFIVEIIFAQDYEEWNSVGSETAFVVKTSSRPKFDVEYDDVNMYNFRTRVPKKVNYSPISMSFYDDNKNAAHSFYTAYLRATSPIANVKTSTPQNAMYEQGGMNFSNPASSSTFATAYSSTSPITSGHSASLGPLMGRTTSLVREIKLHHVFNYGSKMNTYHFYNPRITSFSPSDLSQMETGDGTDFEFEFMYDGMYVDHGVDLSSYSENNLKEMTGKYGQYPINPIYDLSETITETDDHPSAQVQEENAPSTSLFDKIGGVVDDIYDSAGNVVESVGSGISESFAGISNSLGFGKTPGIAPDFNGIGENLSNVSNMTSGITGNINQNILSTAQTNLGGLGTTVSNAFTKMSSIGGTFTA